MAAPNEIKLPLRRKKQKMDLESLGRKGTSVEEEPWSKFSPRDGPEIQDPYTLLDLLLLYWFSDVGYS